MAMITAALALHSTQGPWWNHAIFLTTMQAQEGHAGVSGNSQWVRM